MRKIFLLFAGTLIVLTAGFSQIVGFKHDKYWIDAGTGNYCSTEKTDGFIFNFSINLIHDP